ncbi:hypothetical protein BDU57DRAFT_294683 [Ampelomyces quisqualis]|uniref:Uncharacterized protein n=1 Tax=Ampelomyces quisqualis TaxID=50730 RepID=A0A6A5QG11_AMPQU|nr:hypothetical protein BDU57DRAFT_294683 [Ampelomyces quisqualis]
MVELSWDIRRCIMSLVYCDYGNSETIDLDDRKGRLTALGPRSVNKSWRREYALRFHSNTNWEFEVASAAVHAGFRGFTNLHRLLQTEVSKVGNFIDQCASQSGEEIVGDIYITFNVSNVALLRDVRYNIMLLVEATLYTPGDWKVVTTLHDQTDSSEQNVHITNFFHIRQDVL